MAAAAKPTKAQAWYRAARPRTLTATYVPLLLAAALALTDGVFDLVRFALSFVAALLLQVAANLINEYVDFRRGAEDLKQSGQGMILKQGLLSPREVLSGAIITVAAGCLIGLYLLTQSGPLLWLIGGLGVLVVITYTAGPLPLAYNGLGEVAVFIFMGPVMVLGAYYVMSGGIAPASVLLPSVPIGLTVAAILHANNVRDIDSDRAVNKRTLAVLLGLRAARIEYVLLVGGAYVLVAVLTILGVVPLTTLIVLLTVPDAARLMQTITTSRDNAQLHAAQGGTARLHGRFGYLYVAGFVAWWLVGLIV
jgi:1,4-dihydroxy-2-naphthoate octaprenyltransferase